MAQGSGGVQTKTTFKVTPESVRNLPHPLFSVAIIGLNAIFVFASPLLLLLGDTNHWNGLFALGFFLLPIGICYCFVTHKRFSRVLVVIQMLTVLSWTDHILYPLSFLFLSIYLYTARLPRVYYRLLSSKEPSQEDLAEASKLPAYTMSVMDWFSVIVNWLFILGALFLFASLFIPGILFSLPGS